MTIRFFSKSDRYRDFSNFANYPVKIDGVIWPTTEHYYQAQKFEDPERQARVRDLPIPAAAKRYTKKHQAKIRPDWDEWKDTVMERALHAKFTQHDALRDLLVGSGDERIEEDSPRDSYWGTGPEGKGQNKLGEMLMRLRAELRGGGARIPSRDNPLFAWLGPLRAFAEWGTSGYPRDVRRRLTIINVMALMIAISSAVYAGVYAVFGVDEYWPLIVLNLGLVVVALLAPLAHRLNDITAALLICVAEYAALLFFVRELGRDSGIQLNYIVVAAVAFAICGMAHLRLVIGAVAVGLGLHLAAWFLYPPDSARIVADPFLLHNLYVSSAATTFSIITLVVGYAFTMADRARAEADSLLANILPEAIAERLKSRPGEPVADAVPNASVLFSDIVGFTGLAQELGAARTVEILDRLVTEFDRLAAIHGVEKIKTIGDGYMAVAGVSRPLDDHAVRLARMALRLPELVARLSEAHGVDLRVRIGIAGGPVMAGVIGADKFSYDVWGETVNLASRLESHGIPGEIQVTAELREALQDGFVFEPRGHIDVKGVGLLETWLLKAERGTGQGVTA
jgi:adenylate cyclase